MNAKLKTIVVWAFALLCGTKAFGQEWEISQDYRMTDDQREFFYDAVELSDGSIVLTYSHQFQNGDPSVRFYSHQPALMKLSAEGETLCQKDFFKPGYQACPPYVFEDDATKGSLYALVAYNPDHDHSYFNYYRNYENPTDHSILALYKLDDDLSVVASHEHTIPIDTFEYRNQNNMFVQMNIPNEICGNIYLYSAIVDKASIVGVYHKGVSYDDDVSQYNPRGNDTVFVFRMGFDGAIINKVGFEYPPTSGAILPQYFERRNQLVATDDGYILYLTGIGLSMNPSSHARSASYLDKDFNLLAEKNFHYSVEHASPWCYNMSVKRSNHNTTYLCTQTTLPTNSGEDLMNCSLIEYDDDISNSSSILDPLRQVERVSPMYKGRTPYLKGVDFVDENAIYFAYVLNDDTYGYSDSYLVLECLDANFDTISTRYYDIAEEGAYSLAHCVLATKDGGVIIVFQSRKIIDQDHRWVTITKFSKESFVGIDEAHNNGLKVAVAYPNPGNDVLNIRTALQNAHLEIYNLTGKLIYNQEIIDNITSINSGSWSSGTYVWKVIADGKEAECGKWIKK